jgi:hypothetical protein
MQSVMGRKPWYVWYSTPEEVEAIVRPCSGHVVQRVGMFPVKPNTLPGAAVPLLKWLESAEEDSLRKRVGHIQLMVVERQ